MAARPNRAARARDLAMSQNRFFRPQADRRHLRRLIGLLAVCLGFDSRSIPPSPLIVRSSFARSMMSAQCRRLNDVPQLPQPPATWELFRIGRIGCGPTQLSTSISLLEYPPRADSSTAACWLPPAQKSHSPCAGRLNSNRRRPQVRHVTKKLDRTLRSPLSNSPFAGHIPHSD